MARKQAARAFRPVQEDALRRIRRYPPIPIMRMRHPEGGGFSFSGRRFEADARGVVRVPLEAVLHLRAHGFVPVEEE